VLADSAAVDADEYRRMAAAGERHWWYRSTRLTLRQLLDPHLDHGPDALHLDAGGGTGATGGWLTESATTVLADFEPMALEVGRADFDRYLPARADLNRLPFADASFSTVLCVTALCHRMNPDPAAIVRDFARITRPGGIVCLWEPGGKRLWRGHDEVTHTARRFSVRELRGIAGDAGLDVIRATGAYTFLVPPAAILGLIERGKDKSDVGRNESGLGGAMAALATVERRLLRRFDLPFGLSAIVVARRPLDR
jgi:SAM-dependent methyltransferase